MKRFLSTLAALCILGTVSAQDTVTLSPEVLGLKLKLLDARLQLIDNQISSLTEIPRFYQDHIVFLDSVLQAQRDSIRMLEVVIDLQEDMLQEPELLVTPYKGIIHMDPTRLFEGTLQLGYERMVAPGKSLDASVLGTYVTRGGLGSGYLENNDFALYSEGAYYDYTGDMFKGLGLSLRLKSFLGQPTTPGNVPPLGLYAGPQLFYRHVTISGYTYEWDGTNSIKKEVTQNLDVASIGVVVGGRFRLMEVFSVDMYVGGLMRLSTYANEKGLTKYKKWSNIDYSGVLPTAGITVGILR